MGILIAILLFCLMVVIHEFGHFLAGKVLGFQINEFMLGLGPKIIGKKIGETVWSIHLLPFGGACTFEGEIGDENDKNPRSYFNKPAWQRAIVVAMGPLFNILSAFIASIILCAVMGISYPVVNGVLPNTPAEETSLQAGDEIIQIDGYNTYSYDDVNLQKVATKNKTVSLKYRRDGKIYEDHITAMDDNGFPMYGFTFVEPIKTANPFALIKSAACELRTQVKTITVSFAMLFSGEASLKDTAGPVGIVKVMGDVYDNAKVAETEAQSENATFSAMISLFIMLSVNLGIMNLLPIPALDGGRLFIMLIEAICRKKLSAKQEKYITATGMAFLMILMGIVFINDIYKIIV